LKSRGIEIPTRWIDESTGLYWIDESSSREDWALLDSAQQEKEIKQMKDMDLLPFLRVNNVLNKCFNALRRAVAQLDLPGKPPMYITATLMCGRGDSNPAGGRLSEDALVKERPDLWIVGRENAIITALAKAAFQALHPKDATVYSQDKYNSKVYYNIAELEKEHLRIADKRRRGPRKGRKRSLADITEDFPSSHEALQVPMISEEEV
jgi:hypothetical protein